MNKLSLLAFVLSTAVFFGPQSKLIAQTETPLHSFLQPKITSDGSGPTSLVQGPDGNFYGTTFYGGSDATSVANSGNGTIFKMTPAGAITILHVFRDGTVPNDDIDPNPGLVFGPDGNLYGTTSGGYYGYGSIFKITPSGSLTILHQFGYVDPTVANEGSNPTHGLVLGTDGNFYGTTSRGGAAVRNGFGNGTFFRIAPAGDMTIVRTFSEGFQPKGDFVRGNEGDFYGTSGTSASVDGDGSIFKITPAGHVTILHNFIHNQKDGLSPFPGLVLGTDGNFYGMTTTGEVSTSTGNYLTGGAVFKITPAGKETVLHTFGDGTVVDDLSSPSSALVQGTDGNFYGAAADAVFEITPSGVLTVLHRFDQGSIPQDGTGPNSLFLAANGSFYGTNFTGGSANAGTVYRMTPLGDCTPLHSFRELQITGDGSAPYAGMIKGSDGNFYGMTYSGGTGKSPSPFYVGAGTIYKLTPNGVVSILHSFGDGTVANDGIYPTELLQGKDGNFYGITGSGGAPPIVYPYTGSGTFFKISPTGTMTILHCFKDGTVSNDGVTPGEFIQGSDGFFYGTTASGGANDGGTVFKMSTSGQLSILHSFIQDGKDGWEAGGLIEGSDGSLYGTTAAGGLYARAC